MGVISFLTIIINSCFMDIFFESVRRCRYSYAPKSVCVIRATDNVPLFNLLY